MSRRLLSANNVLVASFVAANTVTGVGAFNAVNSLDYDQMKTTDVISVFADRPFENMSRFAYGSHQPSFNNYEDDPFLDARIATWVGNLGNENGDQSETLEFSKFMASVIPTMFTITGTAMGGIAGVISHELD